jgi:hypothetical protein
VGNRIRVLTAGSIVQDDLIARIGVCHSLGWGAGRVGLSRLEKPPVGENKLAKAGQVEVVAHRKRLSGRHPHPLEGFPVADSSNR